LFGLTAALKDEELCGYDFFSRIFLNAIVLNKWEAKITDNCRQNGATSFHRPDILPTNKNQRRN
jgi:hypothetical protein